MGQQRQQKMPAKIDEGAEVEDEKEAGKNRTQKPGGNADKECKVSEVEGGGRKEVTEHRS
jgi:hypothetical protein